MLSNIILFVGIFIIFAFYIKILFVYILENKREDNISGNDCVREILNDDSLINVVENRSLVFSRYNIKRKMIKLSSNDYNGSSYFISAVSSLLSGYALCKNRYLNIISYVFREIKFITFSPIISFIVSIFVYNIGDAKIGTLILLLILFYQYMLVEINTDAYNRLEDNKIKGLVKVFVDSYIGFFVASLVLLLRLIVIIMGM